MGKSIGDCSHCSAFIQNPRRYTGRIMGRRGSQTTTYWLDDKNRVVCGCFTGTIEEFKIKVVKTHNDNNHAKDYQKYIAIVEKIMEMEVQE